MLLRMALPIMWGFLEYYDSLFVSYPFRDEKYGHAQFGWGGGMEHQTMSYVVSFDWRILHMNLVIDGWRLYLWWLGKYLVKWRFCNISWRSYESIFNQQIPGTTGNLARSILSLLNREVLSKLVILQDVIVYSSRLSYNKGSYLLHMLRWRVRWWRFLCG